MKSRIAFLSVGFLVLAIPPHSVLAGQMTFTVLENSRAAFKSKALLETLVDDIGTRDQRDRYRRSSKTAGRHRRHPSRSQYPQDGPRQARRGMLGKDYLDARTETNRYAVFELKGIEVAGSFQPGAGMPARLRGTLTIKGVPVNLSADAHVTYLKLAPEQLETQRGFGFTSDIVRVSAKFNTSFTNHRMQIPQVMFSRLSNDIQLDVDLTLVRK